MFGKVPLALDILRREGIPSLTLKTAYYFDIDPVVDYWFYDRWGFDKHAPDYDLTAVWIDPDAITHNSSFPFPIRDHHAVVGVGTGSWDRYTHPVGETRLYRSFVDRFEHDTPWEDTEMYRWALANIERGEHAWNYCTSRADLDERCARVDRLYEQLRESGYLTQRALYQESEADETAPYVRRVRDELVPNEIRIAIGRDGTVIRVASAKHRLYLAKLLGIDRIPAIVQIEHAAWPADAVTDRFDPVDPATIAIPGVDARRPA